MRCKLAYVLCAGVGQRLRPLTLRYPKALLPIHGKPMVFHVLDALRAAGVRRFLVNLHAHPAIVRNALRSYGRKHRVSFTFLFERKLLDTGGALRNAIRFLKEPFWLVNCDFLPAGFSFKGMDRAHQKSGASATLAVRPIRPGERFNPVGVSRRRIVRVGGCFGSGGRDHVFLGVHRLEPDSLAYLSKDRKFPIFGELYKNMFQAGEILRAYPCRPRNEVDPGTLEGYYSLNFS